MDYKNDSLIPVADGHFSAKHAIKPPADQSVITVDGKLDANVLSWRAARYASSKHSAGTYPLGTKTDGNILPYELVFAIDGSHSDLDASTHQLSPSTPVVSSFNGFNTRTDCARFLGVSNTRTTIERGQFSHGHNAISATVQGTAVIYNTGNEPISAGQLVEWDLPLVVQDETGLSPAFRPPGGTGSKFLAMVRGVDPIDVALSADPKLGKSSMVVHSKLGQLREQLENNADDPRRFARLFKLSAVGKSMRYYLGSMRSTTSKNVQSALNKMVNEMDSSAGVDHTNQVLKLLDGMFVAERMSHVFGKAVSSAASGESFTVVLGSGGVTA